MSPTFSFIFPNHLGRNQVLFLAPSITLSSLGGSHFFFSLIFFLINIHFYLASLWRANLSLLVLDSIVVIFFALLPLFATCLLHMLLVCTFFLQILLNLTNSDVVFFASHEPMVSLPTSHFCSYRCRSLPPTMPLHPHLLTLSLIPPSRS